MSEKVIITERVFCLHMFIIFLEDFNLKEIISIGNRKITYELTRKNVKNINVRIKSDMTISVSANSRVSKRHIEEFLISKADWIEKTIKRFEDREKNQHKEIVFANGEKVRLLGKDLIIKIIPSKTNQISFDEEYLYLFINNPKDEDRIRILWSKWFETFIKDTFSHIVKRIYPIFIQYNIKMPKLKLRTMKTRWGTCAVHTGTITLNKMLIYKPIECIEYVVTHEFTHFIHPNHGKEFYNTLESVMPDHKMRRKMLEK